MTDKTDNEIKCPILSKVNQVKKLYKQKTILFNDKKVVITSVNRNNDRCIIYLPGFDDYFYHHHVVEEYQNIDFISLDIPGFGFNKGHDFDNHLQNMDTICYYISETTKHFCKYKTIDLMGFSTGGHIATYYVWKSEQDNTLFRFRKLLLISPLLNIYLESTWSLYLGIFVSRLTYAFSSRINIRSDAWEYESYDYPELKNIYSSEKLKKYKIKDFNIFKVGGHFRKPISNGTIVTILNNIQQIIKGNKITTPIICVCSTSYGPNYLTQDSYCHHQDITTILHKISDNYQLKKFECGHQPLKQPFFTDVSFIDICNFIFEYDK